MQRTDRAGSAVSRSLKITVAVWLFGLLLISITATAALEATERIVWRKVPIALDIGAGAPGPLPGTGECGPS